MTNQPTEIAIVGGGMVGGALALGLAQHGFAVTVIEHAEPAPFVADSQPDVRISAISAASVSLLKGLGVWDAVQAMRCHPYRRLETWEWETAHVVFDAAELKLPLLGYMVENTVLQQALWQALEAHPKVTLRVPGSLIALHRHDDLQELELKGGEVIRAKLVIGADGANSQVRQMAGIGVHAWQYAQSCMLISVQCENDPGDSTWQQFTPDGPRAFLPLFDNWASLVWYDSPARIRHGAATGGNREAFPVASGLRYTACRWCVSADASPCVAVRAARACAGGRCRAYHPSAGGAGSESWLS